MPKFKVIKPKPISEEERVEKAKIELSQIEGKINALRDDLIEFPKKIKGYKKDMAGLESDKKKLASDIVKLGKLKKDAEKELSSVHGDLTKAKARAVEKISEIDLSISKKQEELDLIKKDIKVGNENVEKIKSLVQEMLTQYNDVSKEYQENIEKFLKLLNSAQGDLDEKTYALEGVNKEIQVSQLRLDNLNSGIKEAEKKAGDLNKHISKYNSSLENTKSLIAVAKKELSDINQEIEDNKEEYKKQRKLADHNAIKEKELNRKDKALRRKYQHIDLDKV